MGILQARILSRLPFHPPGDLPGSPGDQPRDQTQVFHIGSGFLTTVPLGKPKRKKGKMIIGGPLGLSLTLQFVLWIHYFFLYAACLSSF